MRIEVRVGMKVLAVETVGSFTLPDLVVTRNFFCRRFCKIRKMPVYYFDTVIRLTLSLLDSLRDKSQHNRDVSGRSRLCTANNANLAVNSIPIRFQVPRNSVTEIPG